MSEQPMNHDKEKNNLRFLGIPDDNQLIEDSSLEGILHGRKISEVVSSDTKELKEAGLDWDRAIYVLKCLSIACEYQNQKLSEAYGILRKAIFGDKETWEASETEKENYNSQIKALKKRLSKLVGFSDQISIFETGARFQFDNPINDDSQMKEETPFDFLAYVAPERDIVFKDGNSEFESTINRQTLYIAEAYHLLEKGNRYEMTGENLAKIVGSFDEQLFFEQLGDWMEENEKRLG